MRLRDLGEFGLIDRIARAAARAPVSRDVVIGIGDDAALLRPRAGEDVVVSTDASVEDVHFRWRNQAPRTIGRRAAAASLSDLAAMGARPLGFTVALAAPETLPVERIDGIAAGLLHEARVHGCSLLGGNVTRARQTSLVLTVLGAVKRGAALTRVGSRAGDRVCVTGSLGGAALALALGERRGGRVRRVPTPRLRAGIRLGRIAGVRACIDVSDGLLADLFHLLGDELHLELDPARVPRPRGFAAACARAGLDADRLALAGGEDFELLFTVRPDAPGASALARRLGVPVTELGRVEAGPGPKKAAGWRHF